MFGVRRNHIGTRVVNVIKQCVRHQQINTRRPRKPHFWAKMIKIATQPVYPKEYDVDFPIHLKCRKSYETVLGREDEENPYERILANEVRDELFRARMILLLHRNPIDGYNYYKSLKTFKKVGMSLMTNSRQTFGMAVEETKYSSLLSLFHSHTTILCSPDVKLAPAYKLLKTYPFFTLLAGVIEDRFLNRDKLDEYSALENADAARGQICATLNFTLSNAPLNLSMPSSTVSSYLNEMIKARTNKSEENDNSQSAKTGTDEG